jgi:hypothetical protein
MIAVGSCWTCERGRCIVVAVEVDEGWQSYVHVRSQLRGHLGPLRRIPVAEFERDHRHVYAPKREAAK